MQLCVKCDISSETDTEATEKIAVPVTETLKSFLLFFNGCQRTFMTLILLP